LFWSVEPLLRFSFVTDGSKGQLGGAAGPWNHQLANVERAV
jgi:hypothetical protein